jgi:hypothetical protein
MLSTYISDSVSSSELLNYDPALESSLATAVFLLAFFLSDSLEGDVALVAATFIVLTADLALAFWGRGVLLMFPIVVEWSFNF